MLQYPHRAYTVEDVLRSLKLLSPKDPQKQAAAAEQVGASLRLLHQEGFCRDITPNAFKTRLYLDEEKAIEHAFVGGLGNVHYRFCSASVFRLNIGVLSLFFIRNEKAKGWRVSIFDSTIGKNYCLFKLLGDGAHLFGTNPKTVDGETGWAIEGKYIEKTHVTILLSGNQVEATDHRTPRGTRVDHLTDAGLAVYSQVADQFLKSADGADKNNPIKRGRFVLDQLLQHHKNFETVFFSAVLDSLSLKG
jgi:hypothetical protein